MKSPSILPNAARATARSSSGSQKTIARHGHCRSIQFYSISERVSFYTDQGYALVEGRKAVPLDDERYVPMEKAILHHLAPSQDSDR